MSGDSSYKLGVGRGWKETGGIQMFEVGDPLDFFITVGMPDNGLQ